MTGPHCPICEERAEDARWIGPVTLVLEPCGHQVDDRVYRDMTASSSGS